MLMQFRLCSRGGPPCQHDISFGFVLCYDDGLAGKRTVGGWLRHGWERVHCLKAEHSPRFPTDCACDITSDVVSV